jgi:hypothetical protein
VADASPHLHWPLPIAVVAALVIEGFGFTAISTALTLREYNVTRRKSDPAAPTALPMILVGVYFAAAVGLTVLMDIVPGLARFAPAVFPVFSLAGMTIAALRVSHKQRLADIAADKEARKAERQERNASKMQADAKPALHQCLICSETFSTKQAKAAHMRWTHSNGHANAAATIPDRQGDAY